ncbi:hypothetical protein VTL71DRAFT_6715 [Oculimacula yallundae]|uniref:Amino acid permease/ SLC12A domain-containing protein n=1 Tax=Oculimacula yallundae TaxID=86028 RepID=A0ABR4BZF8_9HELO
MKPTKQFRSDDLRLVVMQLKHEQIHITRRLQGRDVCLSILSFNLANHVKDQDGSLLRDLEGSTGSFLAMWTTIVHAIFAYVGMDIFTSLTAESKSLVDAGSMKRGARNINLHIITLYTLAMLIVSFVVPRDHPCINGKAQSVGAKSPSIIALVEAGLPSVAHFPNATFVFSWFTCAINSMYVAARVLYILAADLTFFTGKLKMSSCMAMSLRHKQLCTIVITISILKNLTDNGSKPLNGMVACIVILKFNAVASVGQSPFNTRRFIASYVGVTKYGAMDSTFVSGDQSVPTTCAIGFKQLATEERGDWRSLTMD